MAQGPQLERLHPETLSRVVAELQSALKRRSTTEAKLAGALRVLVPHSAQLRTEAAAALGTLVRRGSFDRELSAALMRALAVSLDERVVPLLVQSLASEQSGGLSALCCACFVPGAELDKPLAQVASGRHPHLAFAAELARANRGQPNGEHLVVIAPKIKESHRISLCKDVLVPLSRGVRLPAHVGSSLAVLRDAERHLGRWLVMAELGTNASDPAPLAQAQQRATDGPSSTRTAWALAAWVLGGCKGQPAARPTAEIIARLSDRPSADHDMTFLFRIAQSAAPSSKILLEALAKSGPPTDELSLRAAMFLARDHGRNDMREAIRQLCNGTKRDDLSGMAIAALWDAGDHDVAKAAATQALGAKSISTIAWASLVLLAAEFGSTQPLVDEPTVRRVQWGWLD